LDSDGWQLRLAHFVTPLEDLESVALVVAEHEAPRVQALINEDLGIHIDTLSFESHVEERDVRNVEARLEVPQVATGKAVDTALLNQFNREAAARQQPDGVSTVFRFNLIDASI